MCNKCYMLPSWRYGERRNSKTDLDANGDEKIVDKRLALSCLRIYLTVIVLATIIFVGLDYVVTFLCSIWSCIIYLLGLAVW